MSIEAAKLWVTVGSDTRQGEAGLNSFNDKLENAAQKATQTGAILSAGITAPLVLLGTQALSSASDFEQSMNILQQVTGASTDQMAAMNTEALQLGAQTVFSAGEAASAMLELGKAGMSTQDVMQAIPGVLDLAAAGGIGLAQAADLTASALNAFHLKASESTSVASLFAAAANASTAEVADLGTGMQQAGFAFYNANQPIENLAASIAILTNVGLTGSDAGTALKNAFVRIMDPTKQATDVMDQLGISFYDTAGRMKALPDIIDMLNMATRSMTDQQRDAALATIFGSDGLKAFLPLMAEGSAGFNTMTDAVTKQGAATEVANARMKGAAGGLEYLSGSIDSFEIGAALPFLGTIGNMERGLGDLISWVGALPQPVINAGLAFLGVLAVIGPLLLAFGAITTAILAMDPILLLVALGVAGLAAVWASDFGGIQESTLSAINTIRPYFMELLGWIDSAHNGDWGPLKNGLEGWGKQIQLAVSSFAWDTYVKALDWGAYIIALPWNSYISDLNWSAYVTVLGWSSYLTTLAWDTYIDSLTWGPWISHLLWDTYVSVLAWSPWLSNLVWDVYVDSLDWGSWISALTWNAYVVSLNWRDFLLSPDWNTWLDPVTWETYIPNLVWSTYLSAISWGNYVGLLLWNTYVSALSWGDYVSHLNWGDYLPHFTWGSVATKSLDWGAYITLLPWGNYVQQLVWNRAISDIVWTKYIAPIDWGTFLPKLAAWNYIVNPVNWNGFIGALVWETVLGKIDWKQFVSNFTDWSTAATPILWSDFVTYLHWDAFLYGIRWDQFVPVLEWPKAIFDFDWGRFIPDFLKGMFGFGGNDKSTSSSFPSLKSLASPQMAGPNDILAQGQREQAMSLGQTFGAAGLDALMTGLHWPQFPSLEDLGFHWPAIPIPDWWNDLLKATGLAQSSAASALDIYDNIVAVADRISNNNGSGGGGSTGGDNGGGVVVDPNQPNFPAAAAFAAAGNGGDVIYIDFGGVTINTPIDLEAFKLDIINTIRRKS